MAELKAIERSEMAFSSAMGVRGVRNDSPLNELKKYQQFKSIGRFLPADLINLLEIIKELIKLNS